MRDLAKRFMELFDGLDRAYGTYEIDTKRADGKQLGKATTLKKPVTIELWMDHLQGKQGIGIIPIRDNSTCKFGAIDIDVYSGLNLTGIIKEIKNRPDVKLLVMTQNNRNSLLPEILNLVHSLEIYTFAGRHR